MFRGSWPLGNQDNGFAFQATDGFAGDLVGKPERLVTAGAIDNEHDTPRGRKEITCCRSLGPATHLIPREAIVGFAFIHQFGPLSAVCHALCELVTPRMSATLGDLRLRRSCQRTIACL